jgi:hypothetical protein
VHSLEFFEHPLDPGDRKITVHPPLDITMAALKVAAIRDLKFEVTERRNRRGFEKYFLWSGSVRKSNQPLIEAKLDEFSVPLWNRGVFSLTKPKKELIGVKIKLIKLIRVYIEKIRFLKVLEDARRSQDETSILGGHLRFPWE